MKLEIKGDIVFYGGGNRFLSLCELLKELEKNIYLIDSDKQKHGIYVGGYKIESPDVLFTMNDVSLCITVADFQKKKEIRNFIKENYISNINEIQYEEIIFYLYKIDPKVKESLSKHTIPQISKNNIIFDCYYSGLGLGGIEIWTMGFSKALLENGYENTYIISKVGSYNVPEELKGKIIYANRNGIYQKEDIYEITGIILEKLPCKVITSHVNEVMLAAYLIKCFYPDLIEIISVIHNGGEHIYERYLSVKNCSDLYIGVSEDIEGDMIDFGIEPNKIYSITCPFSCDEILNRSYTLSADKPIYIGYAGRMDGFEHSQKRMDILLNVIRLLYEKKVNFYMELAGDGDAREEMQRYIYNSGFEKRVVFLGRLERSEISDFWKKQDICINTADFEGRCISKLEAMANGAIPIVTETTGMREDILDGVNGYLVPLEDYRTMVDRIQFLAEHRELLPQMGKLAHDEVYPKSLMSEHLGFWIDNILG